MTNNKYRGFVLGLIVAAAALTYGPRLRDIQLPEFSGASVPGVAQAVSETRVTVSEQNLDQFLSAAGFPATLSGDNCRHIEMPYESGVITLHATLSASGRKLWMNVSLIQVDPAYLPADRLAALLRESGNTGAAHFTFTADNYLQLSLPLDTHELSTDDFRQEVANLAAQMKQTEQLWRM